MRQLFHDHFSGVANRYADLRPRHLAAPLAANLQRVWGDPHLPRQVLWPLAVRMGRRS